MINFLNLKMRRMAMITAMASLILFSACNDDKKDPAPAVVASFQATVSDDNFLMVSFTNASMGTSSAATYAWDFGDGTGMSTDREPTYTYAEAGTYLVELTVTEGTATDDFSHEVAIVDPDQALGLLTGTTSKTWKLLREGTALYLASGSDPSASGYTVWWAGTSNNGERPCMYDDEFTFSRDGTYAYNDGGTFWAEFGVFNNVADCDSNTRTESCFVPTQSNMVNECGDNVSAWLSSTSHSFEYNTSTGKITLNGEGAWIGIPKLGTDAATYNTPRSSVTFDARVSDGGVSGVDTLYASFDYGTAGYWPVTYVSYSDPSAEPDLVSLNAAFGSSSNGLAVTFVNSSSGATTYMWDFGDMTGTSTEENPTYTYATAGTYTVELTISDGTESLTVEEEVTVSTAALSSPAPTPTTPSADVISIYSDAYTSITGVNLNPGWGQNTVFTEEVIAGDSLYKLTNLDYQGVDFATNMQDVSGMTMVHIDLWSATEATINFFLISDGPLEKPKALTLMANQWTSFDIPLTDYSDIVNLSNVIQFKFDATSTPTFYVDNIYFY